MNYVEIGYVTFFTNVPKDYFPTDEEAESIANQIREEFEARLRNADLAEHFVVLRVEYELGCILTTLSIGAFLGSLYKVVKDYRKLRPNLIQIYNDMKSIRAKLVRSDEQQTTWPYDPGLPTEAQFRLLLEMYEQGKLQPVQPTRKVTKATSSRRPRQSGPKMVKVADRAWAPTKRQ